MAYGQTLTSREEIVARITSARSELEKGLHVRYSVNQKFVDQGVKYDLIHIGVRESGEKIVPFWSAEHAFVSGGQKVFHLTATSPITSDTDRYSLTHKLFDGKSAYTVQAETKIASIYRDGSQETRSQYLLPDEELYKEVIGYESSRQDIGVTLRGYKNPEPYDIATVMSDKQYTISGAGSEFGENVLLFEKPEVDRIWLDGTKDFAILRREFRWGAGKDVRAVIVNSDFQHVDGSVWLPRTSTIDYYGYPGTARAGKVAVRAALSVEHLSLAPPDSLFVVQLEKLDGVVDVVKEKFVKRSDLEGLDDLEGFLADKPEYRFILIAGNVIVILAIALAMYLRKCRAA